MVLRGAHETPRVHHASRRCGCLAACRERAAAGSDTSKRAFLYRRRTTNDVGCSLGEHPNHVGCPMERFFSQQNIERYRKLLDISTDEAGRRLIFKLLAAQTIQMNVDNTLHVRVGRRGDKYTWELHRDGRFQPVKFSVPVYLSEEAAKASGNEARTIHLARLAARRPRRK